jgi:hypothetical protein
VVLSVPTVGTWRLVPQLVLLDYYIRRDTVVTIYCRFLSAHYEGSKRRYLQEIRKL